MTAIKNICRIKYAYIREYGKPPTNEICFEEIEKFERSLKGESGGGEEEEDLTEENQADAHMEEDDDEVLREIGDEDDMGP